MLQAGSQTVRAALPAGWSDADIGSPSLAGSASETSGNWTVTGGGADIWNAADQFNFAYESTTNDVIVAQVLTVGNSDPWAKAGVMFRDSADPASVFVNIVATPGNGVNLQWRDTYGGQCGYASGISAAAPVWVKLVSSNDNFTGYYSTDGSTWIQIGNPVSIPMSTVPLAGLCVTAHNDTLLSTCTFNSVALSYVVPLPAAPPGTFGIYRQLWTGLPGVANTLDMLTNTVNNPNWPDNPNPAYTATFTNFEAEINTSMNNYGQRMRTLVVPPADGNYIFWISSDDSSLLFVSTDENPANKALVASVNSWTDSREWTKEPNQQSAAIPLQAGRRYYVEAQMQQGGGGDNLAVRWALPNSTIEEPMTTASGAGTLLIPFTGLTNTPGIYLQPAANTTGVENGNATFSLLVTNQANVSYQWRLNSTNLPGAVASVLTLSNLSLSLNGKILSCLVSNAAGSITSTPSILAVVQDTNPPTVVQAMNLGTTNVQIVYSKTVATASATKIANYVFTNGLPVTGAKLNPDNLTVVLTTAPMVYGRNYSLVINGVLDRAAIPNLIATNTTVNFQASSYTPQDIGNPAISSTITPAGNGINVTAVGSDFGGNSDQGNFSYQLYAGNFDVSVRVAGLSLSDTFAKAGLMARETLNASSRFAAAMATPAMNGSFFEWRDPASSASQSAGSFPANYPNTWLRVQRVGNVFNGYASYDGQVWTPLGSATITMPSQIYVGLSVSSHSTNQATTAQFRDFTNVSNAVVGMVVNSHEVLGPSARTTPVVISEVMYKPAPRLDGKNLEYIELYNSNPWYQDISGYKLVCADVSYTFPAHTTLGGGAYLAVAAAPGDITSVYGITNVVGPYTGSLKKSETLQLLDEQGAVLLTVPYASTAPWPVAAGGAGHSLVLANPTYGEGDPRAWDISDVVGGSPGQAETFHPSPLRSVVINEFLAHTDLPEHDYIELYNHSAVSVDVSGCILTDDPTTNRFVIPNGTSIPAGGFISFDDTQFNFRLNAAGEAIYFKNPDQSRVLDAVQFNAQENGVATGRWPDGANDFYRLSTLTPGATNAPVLNSPVVINELMYDPISGNDDDQYIELYNHSAGAVDMSGWQLNDGVSYTAPANTLLAAGGYLVIARNATQLISHYPNLNAANCLGNFSGKMSHGGEHIALTKPVEHKVTDGGGNTVTNIINVTVNDLTYGTGGRWGQWAAGGGSSLELKDANSDNRLAANWADSDETTKSVWTNIETTGVLDNGGNYDSSIDYAQIGLLDVGECLVDNVEADYNGVNYVANPDFESGTNGWTFQGDMTRSSLENSGYASSHSLHIRASDRIWTGENACQVALNNTSLQSGQTATLRFKARWLHGWPEVLLRLNGNWLETAGALPVPLNLGTPGLPNSQAVANAGPAIYNVTHTPALPAAGQPAVVTLNAHDANGLQNLTLNYRLDPATGYTAVAMKDDGTGGDALAGDGVFSGTIPGQAANQLVAFYISATDKLGAATRFPALLTDNSPTRECLVRFGDGNPSGSFGVYHLWVSQNNVNRWASLPNLSNEGTDGTMVNGSRVFYNMQGRFAGSPYHQGYNTPDGSLCNYKWQFNDDDKFLGATSFNKIHQPGNGAGDDASIQREQLANTFLRALGVPWLNRRYVVVYVNGNRRGSLMEDAQCPGSDMVKEYWPNDSGGFLYKMQPWFEFTPFPSGSSIAFNNNSWCNLMPYTTTGGVKKTARYRWNYEMRRTPDSANNFNNVFSLVDAAGSSASPNYVANMENIADMENWMRVFAANHAAGNWDSFGAQNAQNLYGYIGTQGTKYSLMMWDFNIVIGNSGSWGPGQNLFTINGQDSNMSAIYNNPTFLRMYWRALSELVNGPLNVANSGPLVDAKYNTFVANGLSVENPNSSMKTWLSQAQSSIASQLAAVNASSFTVNATVTVSNNVASVTGQAPVNVASVWINGVAYPLTWTSLTGWTVTVPLVNGNNSFTVTGVDRSGQPIAGASGSASVNYGGTNPSPVGHVVINEIMAAPAVPDADFVEFYNNSTNTAFDLSGWQVNGLAYTFPAGALLGPTNYLVLTANRTAYATAYGATAPVFDTFSGTLSGNGETLTLNTSNNVAVTKVKFQPTAPWPTNAAGTGASLQLVDANQDNWREGNWAARLSNSPATPQWVYVVQTGTASSSTLYLYLQSAGDVYLDDLKLVAGSVPEAGANVLSDGDFESALTGPWTVSANLSGSAISTAVKHAGNASLHLVATSAGTTKASSIWQTVSPALTANAAYTLSYWYLQSTNGGPLTLRLSNNGILSTVNPAPPAPLSTTPGAANSVAAVLPPFQPLWLNEVEANNVTGLTNRAGGHTAWLELYNPGPTNVPLNGLYLANNYTNLLQWPFPANASIAPGQFKVIFADGLTGLSTTNELHTSFALPAGTGALALTRLDAGSQTRVLDFVDYTGLTADQSYGSFPDGQIFQRQVFSNPTPGATNGSSAVLAPSFVAYNTPGAVYSQNFDALPNPGAASVNADNPITISGVTYSLANPFDFTFPTATTGNGGLGLASLAGWYGYGVSSAKFGATDGDQTTGGQLSYGLPNSSNRALGLQATSSTGGTAFGVRLVNTSGVNLNYLSLHFTGELWRQSDTAKTLQCYYFIDPTGTGVWPTNVTALLPALNVTFPTLAADKGGVAVDGTSSVNQTNLAVLNQSITTWPSGAALWLVWQMTDVTGKAQGLGLDNLSFAATAATALPPITIQTTGGNLLLSTPTVLGQIYQLESKTNLADPAWLPVGSPVTATAATLTFTNTPGSAPQNFFRLKLGN